MQQSFDVVIAGAGPVGLFLACELARENVSVLVLEREVSPESPWKEGTHGRRGLNTISIEAFYRRGLLDKIIETSVVPKMMKKQDKKQSSFEFAGHFAGIWINGKDIDYSRWNHYHLPGPALKIAPTTLAQVETTLAERAAELGIQIIRGTAISSFTQVADMVKISAGDETFEAKWLVGCDGGRSTVRKAAGIDLVGTEAEAMGYIAKCELENHHLFKPGFVRTDNGLYVSSGPDDLWLFDYNTDFDRAQDVTPEHLTAVARRVTGLDTTVKSITRMSNFTDRAKQASQYRKGRVLLAGDAAHIHSPLGAQGLNLGIGDAINLGWKLAATIKGTAAEGLLDTYHTERYPIGAAVLQWARAQGAVLRPGLQGQALYDMMASNIRTTDGTNWFVDRLWGLSNRYEIGDEHELVGRSVPDFEFDSGERMGPMLEDGRTVVVDFTGSEEVKTWAESLGSGVKYVSGKAKETFGTQVVIVRPDGVVGAAAKEVDLESLKSGMAKWIGGSELKA